MLVRILGWLNPWWERTVQLDSPLPPEECRQALLARRRRWPFGRASGRPLRLPIFYRSTSLVFERPLPYQNGWQPIVVVRLEPVETGTRVYLTFRRNWTIRLFSVVWWGLAGVMLLSWIGLSLQRGITLEGVLTLPVALVAIAVIALFLPVFAQLTTRNHVPYLESTIREIVQASRPERA